ncbi:PREDICTED: uncharacterized protein LOC109329956 [Lupinus angustifolius]|uniref:uncharacterized protein LOC109329956 n=1 Tax=Lupinus angustifolius TaxID=3871 RepID=UPI00092F2A15|nr:PREDICTED: uncharacterized protein LOC109329956 [Lupinus angustifolius]XP_019419427.1 PREDICTED: uncharacterized protein LOC109329956 [Lupinus angustifolius]
MAMNKGTCDVTCYTLLEATGDSEADSSTTKNEYAYAYEFYIADDDAQSCSYDDSEICDAAELNGYDESLNIEDDDEEDEKKDNSFYGASYCEDDEMHAHNYKSCVSDDSGQELMDENENNRLFWEACLAS